MPSNDLRAAWADQALGLFQNITRTDREDALPDLLCNLRHLSAREGWSFDDALRRADYHFKAEVASLNWMMFCRGHVRSW